MQSMKSLAIVTGASRGIGQSTALAIADAINLNKNHGPSASASVSVSVSVSTSTPPGRLSSPLHMALVSRSMESLNETARLVHEKCDGNITTSCHAIDLSDLDTLSEKFNNLLDSVKSASYDQCWLINNAGSLGPLGPVTSLGSDVSSLKELQNAVDLNVTSGIWVSSQFAKAFLNQSNGTKNPVIRIVNISSLCAVEPFSTMSIYCGGKAARDMFHSVMAKENASSDNATTLRSGENKDSGNKITAPIPFKVLNYAPGACETEMTDILARSPDLDDGLHDFFSSSKKDQTFIKPEDTAKKIVELLLKDEFVSGSHVDYWDV